MKDIYNKVKSLSDSKKKPEEEKDDGVLVVKVTGDADLKDIRKHNQTKIVDFETALGIL